MQPTVEMQNLKEDEDDEVRRPEIASRISRLRRVLRDLRLELYRERLNLQREHRSTVAFWTNFRGNEAVVPGAASSIAPDIFFTPESECGIESSRVWDFQLRRYPSNLTISEVEALNNSLCLSGSQSKSRKQTSPKHMHFEAHRSGRGPPKLLPRIDLNSVAEIPADLDSAPSTQNPFPFQQYSDSTLKSRSKTSENPDLELASFYKRKICDLEANCCADLNRIRSKYTLASFDEREPSLTYIGQKFTGSVRDDDEDDVVDVDDEKRAKEQKTDQFDSKSVNDAVDEAVATLWTAIDDPFSEADLSSLINEATCINECLPPQIYQELMLPIESTQTNLAF